MARYAIACHLPSYHVTRQTCRHIHEIIFRICTACSAAGRRFFISQVQIFAVFQHNLLMAICRKEAAHCFQVLYQFSSIIVVVCRSTSIAIGGLSFFTIIDTVMGRHLAVHLIHYCVFILMRAGVVLSIGVGFHPQALMVWRAFMMN